MKKEEKKGKMKKGLDTKILEIEKLYRGKTCQVFDPGKSMKL